MISKEYTYFVYYTFNTSLGKSGNGNCEIFRTKPINSFNDIQDITSALKADILEEKADVLDKDEEVMPIVANYILLSKKTIWS